jgi:hypothetical protein
MVGQVIGAALIASLGLLMGVHAWRLGRQRAGMQHWPTVSASIRAYRMRGSFRSPRVDVEVSYRHDGRDYTVWCLSPTRTGIVQDEAQIRERYPLGSAQLVAVNPRRPHDARLEQPAPSAPAILAAAATMLVALGLAAALPATSGLSSRTITLGFMSVLAVVAVCLAAALLRSRQPARRRPGGGPSAP